MEVWHGDDGKKEEKLIELNRRGGWTDECFELRGDEHVHCTLCRMHLQCLSEGLDGYI